MALLSVQEARQRILTHFQPNGTETLPLITCAQRVLAVDIFATTDLPPFDNSSMDGFALRAEDSSQTNAALITLSVIGDIPAGSSPSIVIMPNTAARIMTGAQIPQGANSVIPVEETNFTNQEAGSLLPNEVILSKAVKPGENIRPRGMDVKAGEIVLRAGKTITPQDLGLLATLGQAQISVYKKPRIALFSSGDELLEVSDSLTSGKIRDSNSYMLGGLIESAGAECIRLGVAKDQREAVQALLEKAVAEKVDLILSSAGVSVGAYDFVKDVIESNGRLDFWKVNMRPGKPLAFGAYRGIPFIGLPGNPVSAFVGFEVFVREAISKLRGASDGIRLKVRVRCAEAIESDGRESYLRAVVSEVNGSYLATLTGHQGSGNLLSLVQANALLIIPAGVKSAPVGQEMEAWLL